MNEEQKAYANSVRELATLLQFTCSTMGLNDQQTASLLCAATAQVLDKMFGAVDAVERLRDTADLIERALLKRTVKP